MYKSVNRVQADFKKIGLHRVFLCGEPGFQSNAVAGIKRTAIGVWQAHAENCPSLSPHLGFLFLVMRIEHMT